MDNPYRFVGAARIYRRLTKTLRWGDFYVDNERRSHRPRPPLHPGDCPFCGMAARTVPSDSLRRVTFGDEVYLVVPNINPIVTGQLMMIPSAAVSTGIHRLDLNANDVKLALELARGRVLDEQPRACYVNALPGTGRSVAHLHINCVTAQDIPLLPHKTAAWQICGTDRGTTISRLAGVSFYALAVENENDDELGAAVDDLHRRMNEWQQPYNFLAYPSGHSGAVRVLLVPRDSEYCEAADQRVAGLEFLTGVLIPGDARVKMMDTILRDRALLQATLKRDRQLQLERQLRAIYGLPPAGVVVRARPEEDRFKPVVERNDIFEPGYRSPAPLSVTDKKPVFGEIDGRFWFPPTEACNAIDFHTRRVNANVLVRITRASICQSDRRVLGKQKKASVAGWALGHEGGGYVVDPGPWNAELAAGEKVVVLPHLSCGNCPECHRYMSNVCESMEHLGFDLNGNLADLMAFPYQCVLATGADFPDDALPLIEPLACTLRALFRIRHEMRTLADEHTGYFTIFGGGPMGCLTALAAQRNWSSVPIRIVEPNASRRAAIAKWNCGFEILESVPAHQPSAVTFVASSSYQALEDGIRTTEFGGPLLLFAGINTAEQGGSSAEFQATELEKIHRREQSVVKNYDFGHRIRLIGSSGYILDDVKRSIVELKHHYLRHYQRVQNVHVDGLAGTCALYDGAPAAFAGPAVAALLSPDGVADSAVAESLKVLVRL